MDGTAAEGRIAGIAEAIADGAGSNAGEGTGTVRTADTTAGIRSSGARN